MLSNRVHLTDYAIYSIALGKEKFEMLNGKLLSTLWFPSG